jgi:geranylgeranyl diphosphate synthase type I
VSLPDAERNPRPLTPPEAQVTVETKTQGRSTCEVLTWSHSVVGPALRVAVGTLPASIRQIAGFHLGWWDERGRPNENGAAKSLRPALVLLSAEASRGAAVDAVPAAVAIELVHNFAQLREDVFGGERTRRRRPTTWTLYGAGRAILTGDALLTLAFDVLSRSGRPARAAMQLLASTVQELVHGQSAEIGFRERPEVGLSECVEAAVGRTGALVGCGCALGGVFTGSDPARIEHLRGYGTHLGVALQLVDDLLCIWGDPATTGKPMHSDLANRRKSLPVAAALTAETGAARELAELYALDRSLSAMELAHAAELVQAAGGRAWAQARVKDRLDHALSHVDAAVLMPDASAELVTLARSVTGHD